MKRRPPWLLLIFLVGGIPHTDAASLLLISIDGLHPDYVTQADKYGLSIPHLRTFLQEGAFAQGVVGVVPTVTYPSHTTLVTGVPPAEHGIIANTPYDPLARNQDGWYWYAEDIRVPTLWQAADKAGISTAGINWSVTVGDRSIRYLLPEFWRAMTADDQKLLRPLSRPDGMLEQLEQELGPYIDGGTDTLESDVVRTKFSASLISRYKPGFTAVHLVALDGAEHHEGPFVAPVFKTLESLDDMIGVLSDAALANDPQTVIAVVSDHGFIATHTAVNLRIRFVDAGLIKLKESVSQFAVPTVESWEAQLWNGGATAAVVLRNPADVRARARVAALLEELRAEPRYGIAKVLGRQEIEKLGGFPEAEFLVEFSPGFYLGSALRGSLLVPATSKGTHGYLPDRKEMHATFMIRGTAIRQAFDLGVVDMRSIAPTLARTLGVELPTARQPALDVFK